MKIKYFAWLRDKLGCEEEEITLPCEVTNVGLLIEWLSSRGPRYAEAFEFIEVSKVAVNDTHATNDKAINDDDEVAFIPPISGG